jgi:hypothetical protein
MPGAPRGALVADDRDVTVRKGVGGILQRGDERRLALEHARAAGEPAADDAAFDSRHLQDGSAVGREVPLQQAEAARGLERCAHRVDDVAFGHGGVEPTDLLGQRLAGAGER